MQLLTKSLCFKKFNIIRYFWNWSKSGDSYETVYSHRINIRATRWKWTMKLYHASINFSIYDINSVKCFHSASDFIYFLPFTISRSIFVKCLFPFASSPFLSCIYFDFSCFSFIFQIFSFRLVLRILFLPDVRMVEMPELVLGSQFNIFITFQV